MLDKFGEICYLPGRKRKEVEVVGLLRPTCSFGGPLRSPFCVWSMAVAVKSFWTTSRLKVLWYSQFRGYRVKLRRRVPNVSFLGEIYYDPVWLLSPSRKVSGGHVVKKGR